MQKYHYSVLRESGTMNIYELINKGKYQMLKVEAIES